MVLKEANYICAYCGGPTKRIHLKDGGKENFSKENVIACCQSCCMRKIEKLKPYNTKHKRYYRKSIREIANEMGVDRQKVYSLHRKGKLDHYLPKELQMVLW